MSLTRHQNYKHVGFGWMTDVPAHWDVVPLKRVAQLGGSKRDVVPTDRYVGLENVSSWTGQISTAEVAAEGLGVEFKAGDVLFGKLRPYLAKVALVDTSGIASTEFLVLRGKRTDPNFLRYSMVSRPFIDAVNAATYGAKMPRASWEDIASLPQSVPPISEQRAIADFLDRETARIDSLIAKQEEFVLGVDEKRRATVFHAVTKGVDQRASLRPSGFEWIGDIPHHWLVRPFKRQASRIVVGIAEAATHAYTNAGIPIIRSTNVYPNRIETGDLLYLNPEFAGDRASKMIRAGDLLTARTGHAGVTAVVPQSLDGSQCFTMLITSLKAGYCPHYYSYFLNSSAGETFFDLESWGTAQRNISVPILGETPVCVPPPEEQESVAAYVQEIEAQFEALKAKALANRDLLTEHRSALITAAVTGQVEVAANIAAEAAA